MADGNGEGGTRRRTRLRAALAVLGLAALGLVAFLALGGSASRERGEADAARLCNGSTELCRRHLNEAVFPATHNSFAASEQPGWHFASQRYGIARQLQDGVRALLIDVHLGVYDPAVGRVRTDLSAEGSDRNKVAKGLPAPALALADRLAGRVGLGRLGGHPEPYLCHTLCELGAEPLDRELALIGRFLHDHPDQVLIVIVEDYVAPATIAAAAEHAGLLGYLATLHPGAPLPTLGSLVSSGRRLLVFAEEKGGSPDWYMPAFSFIQDTPLGAKSPRQLSCARYRGEGAGPLLLINHWIPPFPPSPTLNAQIGRAAFLGGRIRSCLAERRLRGAIVAVDFYERTAVVKVARELNGQ
jgi:hypothetical protein